MWPGVVWWSRSFHGTQSNYAVTRGTLEIHEYDPRQQMPQAIRCDCDPQETRAPLDFLSYLRLRHRALTSATVAFAVVALHGLVLVPMLIGESTTALTPQFGAPVTIQATLIDDQSATAITPASLVRPTMQPVHVDLADIPVHRSADPGLAALYGRYLRQIHARIDRAWLRPRRAIGAAVFRCQVEVRQDREGIVQDVTLQRCNGTAHWQRSLVQGIVAASPLPAPPEPAVFAHRVILHFEAVAYTPEQPAGEYRSTRHVLSADNDTAGTLMQVRSLRRTTKSKYGPSVIELHITGSEVSIESQR